MSTPDKLDFPVFTAAKCMDSCLRFSSHFQIQWMSPRRTSGTALHVNKMAPIISRQANVCSLLSQAHSSCMYLITCQNNLVAYQLCIPNLPKSVYASSECSVEPIRDCLSTSCTTILCPNL